MFAMASQLETSYCSAERPPTEAGSAQIPATDVTLPHLDRNHLLPDMA